MAHHINHIAGLRGKAAVHAVGGKVEGLLEPLLEKDEDAPSVASSDENSEYSAESSVWSVQVKPSGPEMIKTAAASLGLMVGAAASVASMVVSPAVAVFVMAGVCIANVPYAAYKEFRIVKLPALRTLNNRLRQEANKLESGVDELEIEIDRLQPEAQRAFVVEEELSLIAADQNYNVDKFVELVKENGIILNEMRHNLRQRIVQDIFKIVMMSDKNNDGRFCRVETKMLVLKISLQLQEYGVEFDESKFYKVMSVDPTVAQTLAIVKRLIPQLNEDEDIDEGGDDLRGEDDDHDEDVYDMFHLAGEGSFSGSLVGGASFGAGQGSHSLSIVPRKGASDRLKRSLGEEEEQQPLPRAMPAEERRKKREILLGRQDGKRRSKSRKERLKKRLNTPITEWHNLP